MRSDEIISTYAIAIACDICDKCVLLLNYLIEQEAERKEYSNYVREAKKEHIQRLLRLSKITESFNYEDIKFNNCLN